jgi:hypothetical protein
MAEILPINTTAADSSDVVVADGEKLTVCLKDAAGPAIAAGARVDIRLKADNGEYFTIDALSQGKPALVIAAEGTYRFSRFSGASCGVFSV